jgi:putative flippase GtrA
VNDSVSAARQAGRFGLVGVLNGVIDFSLFSVLRAAGTPLIAANLVSVSIAMVFSFVANRRFVFANSGGSWKRQAVLFLAGTAFSMYVLQNLTILIVTFWIPAPLDLASSIGRAAGIDTDTGVLLVRSNAAKVIATGISLAWNFAFYRWIVFADLPSRAT